MCPGKKLLDVGDLCQEEPDVNVEHLGSHLLPIGPSGQILEELQRCAPAILLNADGDDKDRLRPSRLESRDGGLCLLTEIPQRFLEVVLKGLDNTDYHHDLLVLDSSIFDSRSIIFFNDIFKKEFKIILN